MILKRFMAVIIDAVIAIIPVLLVALKYPYSFKSLLYLMIFLYFLHTSILILTTGGNTFGEGVFKIRAVSISPGRNVLKKIFLKNLTMILFFLVIIINIPDLMISVISTVMFFLLIIPDHKDKKTGVLKSTLDIVFDICYVDFLPEVNEKN